MHGEVKGEGLALALSCDLRVADDTTLMSAGTPGNPADPEVIGADIPAGGKTSARAIAKMYAALLAEIDGLRLISPEGLEQAATLAVEGKDEVFGNQVRWTLGYALGGPSGEERSETTFGMGGVGGSWAGADTATARR